ncbi:hypothetical protein [Vibrio breoganii]|uniref:hypothetical protein n=1 Tax=Vibrio breoganii TaxID=553239 RepID=UPI000C84EBF1|nr:hypothetical protein [Vibrio breoganii]PMG97745.1 hypothetical protein BCU80_18320 [Vibrio breoganii]
MKITLILKDKISERPPIQALLEDLLALNEHELQLISLDNVIYNSKVSHDIFKCDSRLKIAQYYKFRLYSERQIKKFEPDLIWFCSLDSILPLLYSSIFKEHKYNIQLQELYDKFKFRRFLIKNICRLADNVIVPEYNRAHIIKYYFNLNELPIVLPNKPSSNIDLTKLDLPTGVRSLISSNNKIKVIYQGHIGADRNIDLIAHQCLLNSNHVELYLMGKDHGYLDKLKKINPDIIYLGYLKPPYHLVVTSMMDLGVMHYSHRDLNNIFCAPNKIWEYTGFGLPIISNDMPGVTYMIEKYNIGEIYNSSKDVENAFLKLIKGIDTYKSNSEEFFNSVSRRDIVVKLVNE